MARGRKPTPKPPPKRSAAAKSAGVANSNGAGGGLTEPAGMSEAAGAKWRAIVPLIAAQVDLKEVDADALRQYCESAVLRAKAVAELDGQPLLLAGPNGAAYANPLMKIIKEQDGLMARLSERFGLDPASRRRLQIEAAKKASALSELLGNGRNRPKPALA